VPRLKRRTAYSPLASFFHPDFGFAVLQYASGTQPKGILIDGDDLLVEKDFADLKGHCADVVTGEKGRGDHGPKGEVGL